MSREQRREGQQLKVLAVGAAGTSAGLVVSALTRRGVSVRGLVHSAGKEYLARRNGAAETVVADLTDPAALREAVRGVDAVFHIIPAFAPDEAATGVTLVKVAAEAGISRFVFSSVYHPSLTDLSNHRDKMPAEQALFDSGMDYTILQPAMFMAQLDSVVQQAASTGVISGPYSAKSRMSYVDYRDVAEVAAMSFTSDRFVNGVFELSSHGTYSREDVARILTDLLGSPVRAEASTPRIPASTETPDELRNGLGRMFAHYDRYGFSGGNALVLATMLGREPTSVTNYLAELVESQPNGA